MPSLWCFHMCILCNLVIFNPQYILLSLHPSCWFIFLLWYANIIILCIFKVLLCSYKISITCYTYLKIKRNKKIFLYLSTLSHLWFLCWFSKIFLPCHFLFHLKNFLRSFFYGSSDTFNLKSRVWREGSVIKSAHCFCRGPKFGFQQWHWAAHKHLWFQFQEIRRLLGSTGTCMITCIYPHKDIQVTKKKINLKNS